MPNKNDPRVAEIAKLQARLADNSSDPGVHTALGNVLKRVGRFAESVDHHLQALHFSPDSAALRSNLAATYLEWGRLRPAIKEFRRALAIAPQDADLNYNLGSALFAARDFEGAAIALSMAMKLAPTNPRILTNLGSTLKELGKHDAAVVAFERALANAPDFAEAGWNLSLELLTNGEYQRGWSLYHWRKKIPEIPRYHIDLPLWDGQAAPGATLIIHAEQGLGDTFQFLRYALAVRGRVGRMVLYCQQPLTTLLNSGTMMSGDVVGSSAPPPKADLQLPLLDLPALLSPFDNLGDHVPYITADDRLREQWRGRLREVGGDGIKVGLCWQGNPEYRDDHRRSLPLSAFGPLLSLPGVTGVSLQKGDGAQQLRRTDAPAGIVDFDQLLDEQNGAFMDTAALLTEIDLLVTSDTSTAHLAGAMGVETMLLLAELPDWRWGLDGDACHFYPSMQLFRRQPGEVDWGGVIGRVVDTLRRQRRID